MAIGEDHDACRYDLLAQIVRHSGYADFLRSYTISINGAEVGTIARNSVLDLRVPSGPVTIEARLDWGGAGR